MQEIEASRKYKAKITKKQNKAKGQQKREKRTQGNNDSIDSSYQ